MNWYTHSAQNELSGITSLFVFDCSYEQAHFTVMLSGKTGLWWIGLRAHGATGGGVDYLWDNASLEDCISRGANLVSIHSEEEEVFLSQYSKASSKWIGLKANPTEGGYSWSDGSPLSHTNWGEGEPNNHDGREDCVEMVTYVNRWNCCAHAPSETVFVPIKLEWRQKSQR
uniref:C-type lectin domain-containing protein n=1 Tax=Monopterus albus TaxID=43700 RepID=A0A3Q3IFW4_MONAL